MIRNLAILISAAALAAAADNSWDKVKELKSGTEIRIVKVGSPQSIEAKFDEANEERVVIVVKNEQKAIAREEIARLDARPKSGSRVTTETKTTIEHPGAAPPQATPTEKPNLPGKTTSSSVTFGGKPAWETIYRRLVDSMPTPPPAKK